MSCSDLKIGFQDSRHSGGHQEDMLHSLQNIHIIMLSLNNLYSYFGSVRLL